MKSVYKNITVICLVILTFLGSTGCTDLMDREPLDRIKDEAVWNDPNLIKGYLLGLYAKAPTRRDFHGGFPWGDSWNDNNAEGAFEPGFYTTLSDEARAGYNWVGSVALNLEGFNRSTEYLKYWDYYLIRECNFMITKLDVGHLEEKEREIFKAEARFIRALVYFELVKRYGGVPLITVVQDTSTPEQEFWPTRKTEQEIYDFILDECREIEALLPQRNQSGRADRYTALALLSRAALYAGSIAKYGQVELNGVVGINANPNDYFQISLDASNKIINEGGYLLYDVNANKAENYRQLFLVDNNQEVIFKRSFDGVSKGHSFNYFNVLQGYGAGWGSYLQPTLNLVDAYDFVDGSDGAIDWQNARGTLSQILANKDPRMHASLYFEGNKYPGVEEWDSVKTYIVYGDVNRDGNYKYLNSDPQGWTNWGDITGDGKDDFFQNVGKNSVPASIDGAYTGFFIRKFIKDSEVRADAWQTSTDWYEFRLGEIKLNQAEAAMELGQSGVALTAINDLRKRAGVALLANVDMDKIRKERRVELAFEAHRIWDVRRWRIAEQEMSKVIYGLQVIWKLPDNEYSYIKYGADTRQNDGYNGKTPRYFPKRMYYLPLGEDLINNNPKLIENPGY